MWDTHNFAHRVENTGDERVSYVFISESHVESATVGSHTHTQIGARHHFVWIMIYIIREGIAGSSRFSRLDGSGLAINDKLQYCSSSSSWRAWWASYRLALRVAKLRQHTIVASCKFQSRPHANSPSLSQFSRLQISALLMKCKRCD